MELILTADLAKQLLTRAKADPQLAKTLAAEFLAQLDPMAIARHLLTRDTALALLAERLQKAPEATLRDLSALPPRKGGPARRARGGRKAKVATKPATKAVAKLGKRVRLSKEKIERIKAAVRSFLKRHGWATRKQICDAAHLPTTSIYNRVMAELQSNGEVKAKGEKAKRVYGLKSAAGKTAAKRAAGKKTAAKRAAAKKTAAKRAAAKKTAAKRAVGKKTAAKRAAAKKTAAKKKRAPRAPLLCPVPGCKGKAAPVFGMMCREHKDLPKAKRDELFAARRKSGA